MKKARRPWATWRTATSPLAIFVSYGAVTCTLTWPLAISGDASFSLEPDYLSNLWNIWWLHTALFELGSSPWWTDYLFFPEGISLVRHTLSPLNSLMGAVLSPVTGVKGAFNLLLLSHFWLSGFTCYRLCHYVTGSRMAAYLGGVVYAFCPYHYYYLAQMNVASTEWLPLAVLFLLRSYREGGLRNSLLGAASALLVAASDWYYLVTLFGFGGLLLAFGRLLDPRVPWTRGCARACGTGLLSVVAVAPLAWPLLRAAGEPSQLARLASSQWVAGYNLLGANWIHGSSLLLVSWPTWLGYLPLGVMLAGARGLRRGRFWLLVGATLWILSLGTPIRLRPGVDLFASPVAWIFDLPGVSLFRRPERLFVGVELVLAQLVALAWLELRGRISSRRIALGLAAGLIAGTMLELSGAPLPRFETGCSPYFRKLADDAQVRSLVELPIYSGGYFSNAHYDLCQIDHHKKIPQGYVTSLAVTHQHEEVANRWVSAYVSLLHADARPLRALVLEQKIDLIVLNQWSPVARPALAPSRGVIWSPFPWIRADLMRTRQAGALMRAPEDPRRLAVASRALSAAFGAPHYRDDQIRVFRVDPDGRDTRRTKIPPVASKVSWNDVESGSGADHQRGRNLPMRVIRWIGIGIGAGVALLLAVSVAARFSDGPIAIFAGGPLLEGPMVRGPEPDWSFVRDLQTIQFQLMAPPRSRTTWILESGGKIYVPCGYMKSAIGRLWKQWPIEAERDGRAIVRIEGKRYERQLVRVRDPALFDVLAREIHRKYGAAVTGQAALDGELWLFELAPRSGAA